MSRMPCDIFESRTKNQFGDICAVQSYMRPCIVRSPSPVASKFLEKITTMVGSGCSMASSWNQFHCSDRQVPENNSRRLATYIPQTSIQILWTIHVIKFSGPSVLSNCLKITYVPVVHWNRSSAKQSESYCQRLMAAPAGFIL